MSNDFAAGMRRAADFLTDLARVGNNSPETCKRLDEIASILAAALARAERAEAECDKLSISLQLEAALLKEAGDILDLGVELVNQDDLTDSAGWDAFDAQARAILAAIPAPAPVIDWKARAERAEALLAEAVEALRFYAPTEVNGIWFSGGDDAGQRARATLARTGGQP